MASNQNLDSFNRIKQGVTQSIQELEQFEKQTPYVPAKERVNKAVGKLKVGLEQAKNAYQIHETKSQRMQSGGSEQSMQSNSSKQLRTEYSIS